MPDVPRSTVSEVGPENTDNPEILPDAPATAAGPDAVAELAAKVAAPAYDASAITVLEGLEAVRKRPGMYIGSTGERGLHHLVWEVVDNSVDEALAGHADHIEVTLQPDGGVRVVDNGRGIPTDIMPGEGKPAVEVVLTQLHAGGKFGGGGYSVSGGLHGVGISVVNALSDKVEVEVRQRGYVHRQTFLNGVPAADLSRDEATDETGTTVTFYASPDIFETTTYDFETLRARFQQMAFLNKGLTITLTDERPEATEAERDAEGMDDELAAPVDAATASGRSSRAPSPTATRTAWSTTSSTSSAPSGPSRCTRRSSPSSSRTPSGRCRSRWPCSGPAPTPSRCTPTPTPSTRTRAAPTRRASAPR